MATPHRLSLRFAIALAAVAAGLVACDSLTGPEPPNRTAFHAAPLAGIDISEHPDGFGVVGTTPNLWLAHPGERCGTLVESTCPGQISPSHIVVSAPR